MSAELQRVTVPRFMSLKGSARITMLTAYDYPTAEILDAAGVDSILVGDSLGMVVQGRENTLPVTLDQIIYHAEMVGRAVQRALIVVDLPFPLNYLGPHKAIEAAGRILKETRCQAVKLEGTSDQADVIAALVAAGIPVMAHCGLRPQSINLLGGYRVQRDAEQLLRDAEAAERAGAFAVLLECVTAEAAAQITARLRVPTIGIGAGNGCDGQVLVTNDLLGLTSGYIPKFAKQYANLRPIISEAAERYCAEVRSGEFPSDEQSFR